MLEVKHLTGDVVNADLWQLINFPRIDSNVQAVHYLHINGSTHPHAAWWCWRLEGCTWRTVKLANQQAMRDTIAERLGFQHLISCFDRAFSTTNVWSQPWHRSIWEAEFLWYDGAVSSGQQVKEHNHDSSLLIKGLPDVTLNFSAEQSPYLDHSDMQFGARHWDHYLSCAQIVDAVQTSQWSWIRRVRWIQACSSLCYSGPCCVSWWVVSLWLPSKQKGRH